MSKCDVVWDCREFKTTYTSNKYIRRQWLSVQVWETWLCNAKYFVLRRRYPKPCEIRNAKLLNQCIRRQMAFAQFMLRNTARKSIHFQNVSITLRGPHACDAMLSRLHTPRSTRVKELKHLRVRTSQNKERLQWEIMDCIKSTQNGVGQNLARIGTLQNIIYIHEGMCLKTLRWTAWKHCDNRSIVFYISHCFVLLNYSH